VPKVTTVHSIIQKHAGGSFVVVELAMAAPTGSVHYSIQKSAKTPTSSDPVLSKVAKDVIPNQTRRTQWSMIGLFYGNDNFKSKSTKLQK
jgi:hypothetical protein